MANEVMEKIKKLLALVRNNPSEGEAQAALLMAQKWMAKYHLTLKEVEEIEEEKVVGESTVTGGGSSGWQRALAKTLADNFRCEVLLNPHTKGFIFIGNQEDLEICTMAFNYTVSVVDRGMKKLRRDYRKSGKESTGVSGTYALGFLKGLQDKFKEQIKEEKFELVLVKDSAIVEKAKGMASGKAKPINIKGRQDQEALNRGYHDGKNCGNPHERIG